MSLDPFIAKSAAHADELYLYDDEDDYNPQHVKEAAEDIWSAAIEKSLREENPKLKTYAVDLDGTLAERFKGDFDPEVIGDPIPSMRRLVRRWVRKGIKVVIFTARAADKKNIPPIKKWLKEHGMGGLEITNEKTPEMHRFVDDKAIAIKPDTGESFHRKLAAQQEVPRTGPAAILAAMQSLNLDKLREDAMETVRSKKVSKRPAAVDILNILEGMKRNELTPDDMFLSSVPVIPAAFRPYSSQGTTFIAGDANELYGDVFKFKRAYEDTKEVMGDAAATEVAPHLYAAVKAAFGYGDPVSPKLKSRGVEGAFKEIVGDGPKQSFTQRKMISKPQDSVGRSVIVVDPELKLDEIGVPEKMAWTMYAPYVQRRLAMSGMRPAEALENVVNRTELARKMLDREMAERPVQYSRAPSWYKYNFLGGRPKLIQGDAIAVNPLVTTGMMADFDGDAQVAHIQLLRRIKA